MKFAAFFLAALCLSLLLGCAKQIPVALPTTSGSDTTPAASSPGTTALELENDRICKKMYAVPCHAIAHLPGPMNAKAIGEPFACVNEGVAKLESGKWVADNKYRDPKTGELFGDLCIAVSI